jgi:hypothetical protein
LFEPPAFETGSTSVTGDEVHRLRMRIPLNKPRTRSEKHTIADVVAGALKKRSIHLSNAANIAVSLLS